MSFRQGLIKARSHVIFLIGLIAAFALILRLEALSPPPPGAQSPEAAITAGLLAETPIPLVAPSPLTAQELGWARIAWRYFQNNTDAGTGLAFATKAYPSTTMWDTGSYLLGLVAAERIGIVPRAEFDSRLSLALKSLAALPLFAGELPNKAYNTQTLEMTDYTNKPSATGIGWSALDLARLMSALVVIGWNYPDHMTEVTAVTAHWQLDRFLHDGRFFGTRIVDGKTVTQQEGRIGYEQYGARAAILFGLDAYRAWRPDETVAYASVEGLEIPIDRRSNEEFGASVRATSEPYILLGLELGFDPWTEAFADQVYRAQERRFARTGTLTAVSEGHINVAPYFAYATVIGNDGEWAVLTPQGERVDERRWVSTKAAFAWDALYRTDYTARLRDAVADLTDPDGGFLEGRYENGETNTSETGNTNGIILAALAYRAHGVLLGR